MPERKVWDLGPIVCKIIGLSFDESGLARVFDKLGLKGSEYRSLPAAKKHALLVNLCSSACPVSKQIDRILKTMFGIYRGRVRDLDQKEICRLIETGDGLDGVPLAALIWFAVRDDHEEIEKIDERVFDAIHMREHQALKFYDTLSRMLPHGEPEDVAEGLERALNAKNELRERCDKFERKIRDLKEGMETKMGMRLETKAALVQQRNDRALLEQRKINEKLERELAALSGDLLQRQVESQKMEIESLKRKLGVLTRELKKKRWLHDTGYTSCEYPACLGNDSSNTMDKPDTLHCMEEEDTVPLCLEGRKVAFIGGKDSLMPHYRDTVECFGGVFFNHCGHASKGKGDLEKLVDKVDLVFCPIDINSHYACQCIKKACKSRNKPCRFLRRSSLNTFRDALVEFTTAGAPERFGRTTSQSMH